ncbi:MAG: rod shape-determining protein MreC, partial [Bacteroidales bacterium]
IIPGDFTGSITWEGLDYRKGLLTDVPSNFKVSIGDKVVTSGYSLSFPAGIAIGNIDEILESKGDDFHRLHIRFTTDYNTLQEVYVVRNLYKKEVDTLLTNIDKK